MVLFHIILASFILPLISTTPQVATNRTKAKRTIADQTFSNENGKAVVFYMENPQTSDIPELQAAASSSGIRNFYSAPSKPLALVSVQQPIQVFEQDNPKQVAAQQVLYEFQQTPTNAESNVHVKQLFQPNVEFTTRTPSHQNQQIEQLPTTQPLSSIHPSSPVITANQHLGWSQTPYANGLGSASSYHPATSETIVSPVQHNIYTNHGLNSASFSSYNPLLPQSQQYQNTLISPKQTPGKYIYLNGKIVYHPSHPGQGQQGLNFPQNNFYNRGVYHNQQKLPLLNNGPRDNRPNLQHSVFLGNPPIGRSQPNNYQQPRNFPPITNPRFQPPQQLQQIDKPSTSPQQREESEEEDQKPVNENKEVNEEEDEGEEKEEEESELEDDEEEEPYVYGDFSFEDDEYLDEDDRHHYKPYKSRKTGGRSRNHNEENEDEHEDEPRDARRSANKQNTKYSNSNRSTKYRTPPKYDSNENYAYGEKFSSNMKYKTPLLKSNGKLEKPQGQFKKVQYSKKPGGKPKIKKIEGRFSELIPVTHKHKMYKERWFISKDIEGQNKKRKHIT